MEVLGKLNANAFSNTAAGNNSKINDLIILVLLEKIIVVFHESFSVFRFWSFFCFCLVCSIYEVILESEVEQTNS
jgi:hypothetical protein